MKFYTAFERKILMTKYVVMLCDGMADYPVEELGGKSPMEAAYNKPRARRI